jgi:hypothetical protein
VDDWWVTLLRGQQSDGLSDFAGAQADIVLPVSDRLITQVIAQRLPRSGTGTVREFHLLAHPANRITVRVRLAKPAFLPPLQMTLVIDQQPALPASPLVALAVESQTIAALAGTALRFADFLPAGVRFDGRRFVIDLRTLLEQREAAGVLTWLTDLKLATDEGRVVVHARMMIRDRAAPR